jgi:hypothetical protein
MPWGEMQDGEGGGGGADEVRETLVERRDVRNDSTEHSPSL